MRGCTHLEVLAVNALAVIATVNPGLEALAILFEAARLLAVAAFVVAWCAGHNPFLLHAPMVPFRNHSTPGFDDTLMVPHACSQLASKHVVSRT